jgi:hypothetical protein
VFFVGHGNEFLRESKHNAFFQRVWESGLFDRTSALASTHDFEAAASPTGLNRQDTIEDLHKSTLGESCPAAQLCPPEAA